MNLKQLMPQVGTNAETALLAAAIHVAYGGNVDFKQFDSDAMAIALFSLLGQLEKEHPGISARYGWHRNEGGQ